METDPTQNPVSTNVCIATTGCSFGFLLKGMIGAAACFAVVIVGALTPGVWPDDQEASFAQHKMHSEPLYQLDFIPNHSAVLLRDRKHVLVRDALSGDLLAQWADTECNLSRVGYVPLLDRVVFGFRSGQLGLSTVDDLRLTHRLPHHHEDEVTFIAVHPDQKVMATGSRDCLCLWDLSTLTLVAKYEMNGVSPDVARFSPDATKLIVGCNDGTLRLIDAETLKPLKTHQLSLGAIRHMEFLRDRERCLVANCTGEIADVNPMTGNILRQFNPCELQLHSLAISPDGQTLLVSDWSSEIQAFSLETFEPAESLEGHQKPCGALQFHPQGWMFSAGFDGIVRIWDLETHDKLANYRGTLNQPTDETSPQAL